MPPNYSRRFPGDRLVVVSVHESLADDYQRLKNSRREEDRRLLAALLRTAATLKENPAAGKHISTDRIPKEYRALADGASIWKIDLPGGWRLTYRVVTEGSEVVVELIEWFSHTEYERRFSY